MSSHKSLDKRDHRPSLRVSVVVPCSHVHIQYLAGLLDTLRSQTRRPDQIIFAISGCEANALPRLDAHIVHSADRQTAGSNRNRGSAMAKGDVVIYQDADDLPHPQRVEIIAGLFEKYQIDHLMHLYNRAAVSPEVFSIKQASKRATYHTELSNAHVTNGNPSVVRSLLGLVSWPEYSRRGEDLEFNAAVYRHTKLTTVVELPLLTYRQNLSSFRR